MEEEKKEIQIIRPYTLSRFKKKNLINFMKENNISVPYRKCPCEHFTRGELYLIVCENTKKDTPSYLIKKQQ